MLKSRNLIICVGDSITQGVGADKYFAEILNDAINSPYYHTKRFAKSGTTALKDTDVSFRDTDNYYNAIRESPEIVTIMFGTNDVHGEDRWNEELYR